MGVMTYSAVVLLFGMVIGAIFANTIRAAMQTVKAFFAYLRNEAKVAVAEPVDNASS